MAAPKADKKNVIEGIMKGTVDIKRDLVGMDLSGVDFAPCQNLTFKLNGVNFRGANLQGANLRDIDMRFADLRGADITGAGLDRADLSHAKFGRGDERVKGLADSLGLETVSFYNIREDDIEMADKALIMSVSKRHSWKS